MPDWKIKIVKDPITGKVSFDPPIREVLPGDNIYWTNLDSDAHWPQEAGKAKTSFMQYQIPGPFQGQTYSSTAVSPPETGPDGETPLPVPRDVQYVCSLHPTETGTIHVLAAPPNASVLKPEDPT